MKITRRILHLRRVLGLIPKLVHSVDILAEMTPRLAALERAISEISVNLGSLNGALRRVESLEAPKVPVVQNGHAVAMRPDHEWNRLKLLTKFVQLSGKAREIELEWQKIQQDEADAFFGFEVMRGKDEVLYRYKEGIAQGVRWCVSRFS